MNKYSKIFSAVYAALNCKGLMPGAIALELGDKAAVEALPEFQRAWYAEDPVTKKFKLDATKVEVEDVAGLRSTVAAAREDVKKSELSKAQAVRDALKPFDGIDPVKTRALLDQFASEEEKKLIASGPEGIKKVVEARMEKQREEMAMQIEEAVSEREAALEVASTFMEKVLDNHVRAAAAEAGVHADAVEDVLLRARQIFSLNDDGEAVQFEEDGETLVLGKDGKNPYAPKEWLEKMREKAKHWFPASGSGGGAHGSKGKPGAKDLSGLSPTERLTAAREAQVHNQR